ncbi:MAG TPA: sensor histidine kinase [Bryobacteraceae bacterium]
MGSAFVRWTVVLAILSVCANILAIAAPAASREATLAAAAFSILAVLTAGKVLSQYRRRNEHGEDQPGTASLLKLQEDERKKLSRELHDGVGQIITAMKMELAHIRVTGEGDDQTRLERARSHADEALRTIRNVSVLLRPAVLDDLGLKPALEWLTRDFSRRTSIACQLKFSFEKDRSLPETVRMCAYRTVQEALTNCEKHSGARSVEVEVKAEAAGMQVSITDDGRGISSSDSQERGLGILGMRERAAILGGSLQVTSAHGTGTRVVLAVPFTAQTERSTVRA